MTKNCLSQMRFVHRLIYDFDTGNHIRLTVPYLACQAKKYSRAASGCPINVNDTQNIQLPTILPLIPFIFSKGLVRAMRGS